MWRSVPQIEAASTPMSTSPGPGAGTGTSASSAPAAGRVLRRARMVEGRLTSEERIPRRPRPASRTSDGDSDRLRHEPPRGSVGGPSSCDLERIEYLLAPLLDLVGVARGGLAVEQVLGGSLE